MTHVLGTFDYNDQRRKETGGRERVPCLPLFSQELTEEVSLCQRLDIIYTEMHGVIMVPCHQ